MSLQQPPSSTTPGRQSPKTGDFHPVTSRLVYLPLAILGLGPLLPVIGLMYLVKLVDSCKNSGTTCDECPGPGRCPYFHCCREPKATCDPSER